MLFECVLFWAALKLYREALSVKNVLLACILPVPFLIHGIITAVLGEFKRWTLFPAVDGINRNGSS